MKRLLLLLATCGHCLFIMSPAMGQEPGFSYATLRAKARELAQKEYKPETTELPEYLKKLSYDDYQHIHFRPEQGPWQGAGLRFSFQLFHQGFLYHEPVHIHLLEQGQAREFPFSPAEFDYGQNHLPQPLPANLHFAGFRVLYPLNASGKQDEVASFLGASYFRAIGAGQRYGASFRGLAIDTADPSGEEFPRFTDFWIEKPQPADTSVKLYALLNSPSVAGAYRFTIQPGQNTRIDVESSLFFRKIPKKIGIAPLTSMFMMAENHTRYLPDFRPEVHDSDGLLIQTNEEACLWRPLVNPEKDHVVTQFPGSLPKGFGLLQRDRQFADYQDLVARYELRPSLWVQPGQGWGTGSIELVEIPSPNEYNDNIVAYWVPQNKPERQQEVSYTYSLFACLNEPETCHLLRVQATRITPEHDKSPPRFVIDFEGKNTAPLPADTPVKASVSASGGKIENVVTEKNEVTGGWRTFFDLTGAGKDPARLEVLLHLGNKVLSETWVYHYQQF